MCHCVKTVTLQLELHLGDEEEVAGSQIQRVGVTISFLSVLKGMTSTEHTLFPPSPHKNHKTIVNFQNLCTEHTQQAHHVTVTFWTTDH